MNRNFIKNFVLAGALTTSLGAAQADDVVEKTSPGEDRSAVAVTIYNDQLALIRETRTLNFDKGINHYALRDVSALIRPETASLVSADGSLHLVEQNFDFDLLTPNALFNKYVGHDITVVSINPTTDEEIKEKVKVLANNDGVVLQYKDRIETGFPTNARIQYDSVPENLRDRPTLVASIDSEATGAKTVDLSYLTAGFDWKADYVAELSKDEKSLSLNGWVTLTNKSGTDYKQAKLQLVAGDVNRVYTNLNYQAMAGAADDRTQYAPNADMASENLSEYYLYTLNRPTDLKNNQTKQVALFNAQNVPVTKIYRMGMERNWNLYSSDQVGAAEKRKIETFVSFNNDKDDNLGFALPKGIIRVYKPDSAGNALFIGEDSIDHTPEKQKVTLKLGNAFDVTGAWKRTDYKRISKKITEQTIEIEVANAKDVPVDVLVTEPFSNLWTITKESIKHEKIASNAASWTVPVKPKDKTTLTYTVRITQED